jgi:hypothetical protein
MGCAQAATSSRFMPTLNRGAMLDPRARWRVTMKTSAANQDLSQGMVKWLTALFTPSLLPLPCIESTV